MVNVEPFFTVGAPPGKFARPGDSKLGAKLLEPRTHWAIVFSVTRKLVATGTAEPSRRTALPGSWHAQLNLPVKGKHALSRYRERRFAPVLVVAALLRRTEALPPAASWNAAMRDPGVIDALDALERYARACDVISDEQDAHYSARRFVRWGPAGDNGSAGWGATVGSNGDRRTATREPSLSVNPGR